MHHNYNMYLYFNISNVFKICFIVILKVTIQAQYVRETPQKSCQPENRISLIVTYSLLSINEMKRLVGRIFKNKKCLLNKIQRFFTKKHHKKATKPLHGFWPCLTLLYALTFCIFSHLLVWGRYIQQKTDSKNQNKFGNVDLIHDHLS